MDINRLESEIAEQTRNGRPTVYVRISDMEELGVKYNTKTTEQRVFVDVNRLESLLDKYKKNIRC